MNPSTSNIQGHTAQSIPPEQSGTLKTNEGQVEVRNLSPFLSKILSRTIIVLFIATIIFCIAALFYGLIVKPFESTK